MHMQLKIFTIILCFAASFSSFAQSNQSQADKILRYNIKKAYPLARVFVESLHDLEFDLDKVSRINSNKASDIHDEIIEKHQSILIAKISESLGGEKDASILKLIQLFDKNLSLDAGRLIVKFIHRDTKKTAYHLLEKYLSPFYLKAASNVAAMCGNPLDVKYDPVGGDMKTEIILSSYIRTGYFIQNDEYNIFKINEK